MNKEEIATTYEEYKNGFKLVSGLGRLSCYQGLDYLEELLEKDKFYSEQLEDTIVFIESHINRIEKENQKYKEVIDKAIEFIYAHSSMEPPYYEFREFYNVSNLSELLDILKGVK